MEIHHGKISEITRYIENNKHIKLEDKEPEFERLFHYIEKFKVVDQDTKILEIGIGTGWFPILCKKKGISCHGLEISEQLFENARYFGQKYGIEPDIELGNIEETNIGVSEYDIIVAQSVFEHVEHWQKGLKKVFDAMRPGGLFYFTSTNKFSLISGEYNFPFYGWLPDNWRYHLRISRQNADIMKLGIDFNQFTYFKLRRFFKKLGFSMVLDKYEFLEPDNLNNPKLWKKVLVKGLKRHKSLRRLVLLFDLGTHFICIKGATLTK